jgi:hypothetical protein
MASADFNTFSDLRKTPRMALVAESAGPLASGEPAEMLPQ